MRVNSSILTPFFLLSLIQNQRSNDGTPITPSKKCSQQQIMSKGNVAEHTHAYWTIFDNGVWSKCRQCATSTKSLAWRLSKPLNLRKSFFLFLLGKDYKNAMYRVICQDSLIRSNSSKKNVRMATQIKVRLVYESWYCWLHVEWKHILSSKWHSLK